MVARIPRPVGWSKNYKSLPERIETSTGNDIGFPELINVNKNHNIQSSKESSGFL